MIPAQKINDQTKLLATNELVDNQNASACEVLMSASAKPCGLTAQKSRRQLTIHQQVADASQSLGGNNE